MEKGVRITREKALDDVACRVGAALRARWRLEPEELYVEWTLDSDGQATLHVRTSGAGSFVQAEDSDFDAMLSSLCAEHADVLDGKRWMARVGEEEVVREMSAEAFAARMRTKVR